MKTVRDRAEEIFEGMEDQFLDQAREKFIPGREGVAQLMAVAVFTDLLRTLLLDNGFTDDVLDEIMTMALLDARRRGDAAEDEASP